jgi:hypothetical protein
MGASIASGEVLLLTEFMHMGNLDELLLKHEFPLGLETKLNMIKGCCSGLSKLSIFGAASFAG